MDAVYSTDATGCFDGEVEAVGAFPHPVCADALVLRLTFEDGRPAVEPYYARYEALARRAESRHRWEQPDLW